MQIKHWNKGHKDAAGRMKEPDEADYYFAKFNKKVPCPYVNLPEGAGWQAGAQLWVCTTGAAEQVHQRGV
jgi:hypothetical protein